MKTRPPSSLSELGKPLEQTAVCQVSPRYAVGGLTLHARAPNQHQFVINESI